MRGLKRNRSGNEFFVRISLFLFSQTQYFRVTLACIESTECFILRRYNLKLSIIASLENGKYRDDLTEIRKDTFFFY